MIANGPHDGVACRTCGERVAARLQSGASDSELAMGYVIALDDLGRCPSCAWISSTSFAPEIITDHSGSWASNGLRFATEAEALEYVAGVSRRRTSVRHTRVIRSFDPANYELIDGTIRPVGSSAVVGRIST